jgi:hypothetical protein
MVMVIIVVVLVSMVLHLCELRQPRTSVPRLFTVLQAWLVQRTSCYWTLV